MWQADLIRQLQSWGHPYWDEVFRFFTFLGDERFYLILIPIVWATARQRTAAGVTIVFLASTFLNFALKEWFALPRPYVDQDVLKLTFAHGYSFPSGHAQGAAVVRFPSP